MPRRSCRCWSRRGLCRRASDGDSFRWVHVPVRAGGADAERRSLGRLGLRGLTDSSVSNPSLIVRRATVEDAAAMLELQQIAFAEEGRRSGTREIPPLQEQVGSIVQHVREHVALVAVQRNMLVGTVRGVRADDGYVVRALTVHPTRQGEGIGSMLLCALEAALPKPTRVDLTTNTLMQGNVPFYERHGYEVRSRTEPIPGIVLAHMSKHLMRDA